MRFRRPALGGEMREGEFQEDGNAMELLKTAEMLMVVIVGLAIAGGVGRAGDSAGEEQPGRQVSAALVEGARRKFQAEDYKVAADLLRQALKEQTNNRDAVYLLARCLKKLGKEAEAVKYYRRYLDITEGEGQTPNRFFARKALERLEGKAEKYGALRQSVVSLCRALAREAPQDLTEAQQRAVRNAYGRLTGKELKRPSRTKTGRSATPEEGARVASGALADVAKEKYRATQYEAAAELLGRALDKWPDNPKAVYWMAKTREKTGEREKAAKMYRKYLALTRAEGEAGRRIAAEGRLRKLDKSYGHASALRKRLRGRSTELLESFPEKLSEGEIKALSGLRRAFGANSDETSGSETGGERGWLTAANGDPNLSTGASDSGKGAVNAPGRHRTVEVLRLADPTKHATGGNWKRTPAGLRGKRLGHQKPARISVPVAVRGAYGLRARLVRGAGCVVIYLPVPPDHLTSLVLAGWAGERMAALNTIGGKTGDQNDTQTALAVRKGEEHTLDVRVRVVGNDVEIKSRLDGKRGVEWEGPATALGLEPHWRLPSRQCLGLGTTGEVTFTDLRLRMLSGRAERVK